MISLHWYPASSADDTHADIEVSLDALGCPGGAVYATVSQDADPRDPALKWCWTVYDAWLVDEADELANGFTATRSEARSAVLGWVRSVEMQEGLE